MAVTNLPTSIDWLGIGAGTALVIGGMTLTFTIIGAIVGIPLTLVGIELIRGPAG